MYLEQLRNTELQAAISQTSYPIWQFLRNVLVRQREPIFEVVLLSVVGPLFGVYNPCQLSELLYLGRATLYRSLHALSPCQWKRVIQELGYRTAIQRLKQLSRRSPATISRANVTVILDDSLFVRLSRKLAYVWKWWGGALRRVGRGQDVVGMLLAIGDEIIPLDLRIASKQGRQKKDKITLACEMLLELARRLRGAGLKPGMVRLAADSWYSATAVMDLASGLGFAWISEGKGSFSFEIEGEKLKGKAIKQLDLTQSWGDTPHRRLVAQHLRFGEVVLVVWQQDKVREDIIVPGKKLRGWEAVRAFQNRPQIELFWRELKTTLKLLQIKLQGRDGAYAAFGIRVLCFIGLSQMRRRLSRKQLTLGQLLRWCQRSDLTLEQFHKQIVEYARITRS